MPEQKLLEQQHGSTRLRARARVESRESRLRGLGFRNYKHFLRSPAWEATRSQYWEDPDTLKVCGVCATNEPPLLLHHKTYERVGCERLDDLIPTCNRCHQLVHELERRGDIEGLDADLSGLTDPIRAARNRAKRPPREVAISPENKAQREKMKGLVQESEVALEKAIEKDKPAYAIAGRRRRLDRNLGKLRWLEKHPTRSMHRRGREHFIPKST